MSGGRRTRGRLLFVVVPQVYFLSHRLPLALAAARDGWEVHLATAPGEGDDEIARRGILLHRVPLHRAIASPVQELRSLGALVRLCRALRPTLMHAVSAKGVVLGGVAARMLGIPAVLTKGGMGTAFTEPGAANRLARVVIRGGVRVGLGGRAALVVHNPEEAGDVASAGWMRSRTLAVAGSGVNCQAFHPTPEPPPPVTVTLPARMLRSKGVEDFVAASRLLAARGVRARFVLAGGVDPGNATAIAAGELEGWTREGVAEWMGYCADMPALLGRTHVVCLPSRGAEGLPKALSEAAAAGRPIVTTDVPGCREVVQHGVNGLLVPERSPAALADALERLIGDAELRAAFGRAGREIALARLDENVLIPRILELYRSLTRT